jgi:hypothetical protein
MYKALISRYAILVTFVTGIFTQFVACGSKFYQVSVEDDIEKNDAVAAASDPTSSNYGIHSPAGWTTVPIDIRFDSTLSETQTVALTQAMMTWETLTGKRLFDIKGVQEGVTGDSFIDLYSSLNDFINGHYLDQDWDKTAKSSLVLATTVWNNSGNGDKISTADIRYNIQQYLIDDSLMAKQIDERDVVDAQSLALHELGHFLGLAHVDSTVDTYSIMNPYLYIGEMLTARRPSKGDIQRIQKIYGCTGESCDVDKLSERLETGYYKNIGIQ